MACDVRRHDALDVPAALALRPRAIVLSPGPGMPDQAGICLDLIAAAGGAIPILGVCLGHQAIGQAYGGRVVRAAEPMHCKVSPVAHAGGGVFAGLPSPFGATRYHSLVVEAASLPDCLETSAETGGIIMGLRHRSRPVFGVQFHPESIASEYGHRLLGNFLDIAGVARSALAA